MAHCNRCGGTRRTAEVRSFTTDPAIGSVYTISFHVNRQLASQVTEERREVRKDTWNRVYGSDIAYWLSRGVYGITFESAEARDQFLNEFPEVQAWQLQ